MTNMSKKEEKVWEYLLNNRQAENAEVAAACDVDIHFVKNLISRISSENWREKVPLKQVWDRAKVLDTAKGYVTKDRAADHGDMEDNFIRTAALWNAHLGLIDFIKPHDVPVLMTLLKIARIGSNPKHMDNWVDACGYMACGGEVVSK
tara:strand:- start:122 stop:565 length:444 start_codon:yes stop_codon:yes gene_type:complete